MDSSYYNNKFSGTEKPRAVIQYSTNMTRSKLADFIVLVVLAIAAVPTVLALHARFLTSTLLFFGLPLVFLLIRRTQNLKIIFSGVLLIGVILGFVFDFLATLNNAWYIPQSQLTIPYRVFGAAPVDELICLVFWTFLMLAVYEHFFERKGAERLHAKHFIFAGIVPACVSAAFVFIAFFLNPSIISFKYAYFILSLLAASPMIYCLFHRPAFLKKIVLSAPYFIFLYGLFEITGLKLGQWSFPGHYVSQISAFSLTLPVEEFVIWIIASSTIVLTDYKLFVDVDTIRNR